MAQTNRCQCSAECFGLPASIAEGECVNNADVYAQPTNAAQSTKGRARYCQKCADRLVSSFDYVIVPDAIAERRTVTNRENRANLRLV